MGFFNEIGSFLGTAGGSAIGSSVLGLVGNGIDGILNSKRQSHSQSWQTAEREAAQAYNTSEREAAQAYQTSEREAQNQHAIDIYNMYQSPEALVRQYKAAGLNPRLAMDSGGNISSASGTSGSAPSGSHVQPASVPPPYMSLNGFSGSFRNIADALASLGQAKKAGVETSQLEQMFGEKLRGMTIANDLQHFMLGLNMKFGNQRQIAEIQKLLQDVSIGKATESQIKQSADNLKKQGVLLGKDVDSYESRLNAELRKSRAAAAASEASAKDSLSHVGVNQSQTVLNHAHTALAKVQGFKTHMEGLNEEERRYVIHLEGILKELQASTEAQTQKALIRKLNAEYDAAVNYAKENAEKHGSKAWYRGTFGGKFLSIFEEILSPLGSLVGPASTAAAAL